MYSLRGRVTLILVLGMGLLLLGAGVLLNAVLSSHLLHEFDQVLMAKAKALMTLTTDEGTAVEVDFVDDVMPEFSRAERPEYFAIWRASGTLLKKSPSLSSDDLPRLPGLDPAPVFRDLVLPNGLSGRLVQVTFIPQRDEGDAAEEIAPNPRRYLDRAAILIMARDRVQLDALVRSLHLALAGGIVVLLIVIVALVRLALRVGRRPLDDVQQQVAQLDVEPLTTGFQVHTPTQELMPVVNQLNTMLRCLDAAFTRERQFGSDVAHELRTPLAELRTLAEVGGRWPDDQKSVAQYFAGIHAICEQMEAVVISFLTLTRCERGIQPMQRTHISLLELIEASWLTVTQEAQEKSQVFACDVSPAIVITSDHNMLLMVLRNLLDNAVLHSPPHSRIQCIATREGAELKLTISNPTESLSSEDLPHIFERFWCKHAARSDGSHSGLGLAIVKAFSDLLDLDVQAQIDQQQVFSITLSLSL